MNAQRSSCEVCSSPVRRRDRDLDRGTAIPCEPRAGASPDAPASVAQSELELPASGSSEGRRRERRMRSVETVFLGPQSKHVVDLFRKDPLSAHSRPKAWIVQLAVAHRLESMQDLFSAQRAMGDQPVVEEVAQTMAQTPFPPTA